jgi:uncharacterized membrane protein
MNTQIHRIIVGVAALAALLALIAVEAIASPNIVANAGFEKGTGSIPDGWTYVDGTGTFAWDTTVFHGGAKAAKFTTTGTGTRATLYQTNIPGIVPGHDYHHDYHASCYYKTASGNTGASQLKLA